MTEKEMDEFLDQYVDVKERAMENPFPHPNVELKYDLVGWNRLDYFSMKKPPHTYGPDYRLVFRQDRDFRFFYSLATGLRNAKGVNGVNIYYIAKHQPKEHEDFVTDEEY